MISEAEIIKEMPWTQCRYVDGEPIPQMCFVHDVPEGWRELLLDAFRKIDVILKEKNLTDKYRITQVKEKFGYGRIYDNLDDPDISKIISDFEIQSSETCCRCGKSANWKSAGWICPYCDDCKEKLEKEHNVKFERMKQADA